MRVADSLFFSSDNGVWRSLCDLHSAGCVVGTIALACSLFTYAQGNIFHEEEGRWAVGFIRPSPNPAHQAISSWYHLPKLYFLGCCNECCWSRGIRPKRRDHKAPNHWLLGHREGNSHCLPAWGTQLDLSGFQRPGHKHSETALCCFPAAVGVVINVLKTLEAIPNSCLSGMGCWVLQGIEDKGEFLTWTFRCVKSKCLQSTEVKPWQLFLHLNTVWKTGMLLCSVLMREVCLLCLC